MELQQVFLALPHKAVVIGGSAGAIAGLTSIFSMLPPDFELPVLIAQHLHPEDKGAFTRHVERLTYLTVVEPCDKELIECGCVYIAPANYHMLVEKDGTISLSVDEKVNWSRPSIDVLFESAAAFWGEAIVALLLSGANSDGTKGMMSIKEAGGLTIAQDPEDAESQVMPKAAIKAGAARRVLQATEIGSLLLRIGAGENV